MPEPKTAPPPAAAGGEQPARARAAANRLPELLLAVAVAVNLAVVLSARHFPYHDAVNHLARWTLMNEAWTGRAPPWVQVRLDVFPSPYLAADLLGAGLVYLFGPAGALRAMTALLLVIVPACMYALLRAAAPANRGWALVGALFGFNFFVMIGFLADVLATGLALGWLALWWPRRERTDAAAVALLTAGAVGLYLVHLSGPLIVLVVIWTDYALATLARWTAGARGWDALRDRRLAPVAGVTLAVSVMIALWKATSTAGLASDPFSWDPANDKMKHLFSPLYSLTYTQMAVMAAGYGASLAAFVVATGARPRRDTFLAAAIALVLVYAVFPAGMGENTGLIDVRWLLPAYLLPFCIVPRSDRRPQRAVLLVPLAAVIAHALATGALARRIDPDLDAFDTVLDRIPAAARILPLDGDPGPHRRVLPYHFYAMWHTIRRHGRVVGLFSYRNDLGVYENIRHFVIHGDPQYRVPDYWESGRDPAYDWPEISRTYDYIILCGDDARLYAYLAAHAHALTRAGAVTLFAVEHAA